MLVFLLGCVAFFFTYVGPSLAGETNIRFDADGATYLEIAGMGSATAAPFDSPLISTSSNFLGPVLIALIFRSSWGIALFNMSVFGLSLYLASRLPSLRLGSLFFLLVANLITISALLTLNKEILALFSCVLFITYLSSRKRSKLLLVTIVVVSLMARWEQLAVILLFLALEHRLSPLRGKHALTLVLIVLGITVTYPVLATSTAIDLRNAVAYADQGNLGSKLNAVEAAYGFPLVLLPKMLVGLFWHILTPWYYFSEYFKNDFHDIYVSIVLESHCFMMLIVCIACAVNKKLSLSNPAIYWAAIYLILSSAFPVMMPRYQYPVYVMLCMVLSGFALPSPPSVKVEGRLRGRFI